MINNNIIEQVTDFKYLGYHIAKYKSDLEDKLQTYNKINGAVRRHFGIQMNKETKLTLQHGATSTARPRENVTCRGATSAAHLLHCLTHSTISRQHREKM